MIDFARLARLYRDQIDWDAIGFDAELVDLIDTRPDDIRTHPIEDQAITAHDASRENNAH